MINFVVCCISCVCMRVGNRFVRAGEKSLLVWLFEVALWTCFLIWLCGVRSEKSPRMDIWSGIRDTFPDMAV